MCPGAHNLQHRVSCRAPALSNDAPFFTILSLAYPTIAYAAEFSCGLPGRARYISQLTFARPLYRLKVI